MLSNPRPRVLCVDDDDDCRVMFSTLLRMQLLDVKTVGCSAEALLRIQTERFDLYSLEARLPDFNGFELCRQIRDIEPHVPILFFSGAAYEADRKRGIAAGANGYVIKPDIYSLLRSVEYSQRWAKLFHADNSHGRRSKRSRPFSFEITSVFIRCHRKRRVERYFRQPAVFR